MIDLTDISGLAISLNPVTGELTFEDDVAVEDIAARSFGELRKFLAHPSVVENPDAPAYLLYRGVHRRRDGSLLAEYGLRFDLTVILPSDIAGEQVKTAGHIHSHAPDGVGYPEIYDVLHGQAAFVLQFADPLRVIIAVCEVGERILIPPDASHLTVNIGETPLVVADLVAIESQNFYGDFREKRGAAVHLFREPGGSGGFLLAANSVYEVEPDVDIVTGSQVDSFVPAQKPLYADFLAEPDRYSYLTAPAPAAANMAELWASER